MKNTSIIVKTKPEMEKEIHPIEIIQSNDDCIYEETRQVTNFDRSDTTFIMKKENINKIYFEEINLIDSNVNYLISDSTGKFTFSF